MCPARSPYPDRKIPVGDAFLGLPPPEGVLPDAGTAPASGEHPGKWNRSLTDHVTTCPDGLVEEVLWGLLHGLTAPVTGGAPDLPGAAEAQRD